MFAARFRQFSPEATLDVIPYSERDTLTLIETLRDITGRVVALSSQDVYRAYGLFTRLEEGLPEPAPYNEDAPLRSKLYPYRISYEEKVSRDESLRRPVEWECAHPPVGIGARRFDYAAEDLALSRAARMTRT